MPSPSPDERVLTTSRSWSATPWDYSSLRFLRFESGGGGELIYGYGQTVYAKVGCRFEVLPTRALRLTYLDSPPFQRFAGFAPTDADRVREVGYELAEGEVGGVESVVARPYRFGWTLTLSRSPFPDGLSFPHEMPLVYYGHRAEDVSGAGTAR